MSRSKQPEDDGYSFETDTLSIPPFANGWSRFAATRDIDGIPHVYHEGEWHPNFTDCQIVIEMGHKSCGLHAPVDKAAWDLTPVRIEYYNDYYNSNEEALQAALATQRRLEEEGELVPIYIRA